MIVRLTRRQLERLKTIVPDGPLQPWLERDVVEASSQRLDVWMPAIGWKRIEMMVFDHCYDHRGFRNKRVRDSDLRMLRGMTDAVNIREHHPALMKVGSIGFVAELIPAWKLHGPDDKGRLYSPYPQLQSDFVVLAPHWAERSRRQVTYWTEEERAREMPLLDETNHWALCQ